MIGATGSLISLRRTLVAGAVASAVGVSAAPAFSQMVCGNHADIEKRLETGYSEVRTAVGLAANGGLIEVYTSEKGTFTIILTRPNGMSCLMAVGEGFEMVKGQKVTNARRATLPWQPHMGMTSPPM